MSFLKKISSFLFILAALIGGLVLYGVAEEKKPFILTTNVDIAKKTIHEDNDKLHSFFSSRLLEGVRGVGDFVKAFPAVLDPSVRYLKIKPGLRKEEIAGIMADEFSWDKTQEEKFLAAAPIHSESLSGKEGIYYPDVYFLSETTDGETLRTVMTERFRKEVLSRYASSTKKTIKLETALIIASIIEREAGGRNDMRLVSGVIWNRLFKKMSLDMDATLQYVKGDEQIGWWPKVVPEDKYLKSPYNTYLSEGLPPFPISNPGLASIEAALNPKKTDYLYYIHDGYGRFHGAKNYKEHLQNIEKYLK